MYKEKKFYLTILLILVFSISGCTSKSPVNETTTANTGIKSTKEKEIETTTMKREIPEINLDSKVIPDTDAFTYIKSMKIGWNLGNTFDAFNNEVSTTDDLKYESMWCGATTTKELITALKTAGFETIRIPVSWHNHLSGDNYTISDTWLKRIKEVVDYAIENNMHVILNIHHDNDKQYYYPTSEYLDQSKKYISSIWSQVGDYFKDYDDLLIFESLNEPRMVGDTNEWWLDLNKESCKDAISCINTLNQLFVDTIRSQGGNNSSRYLMIPGYCASADGVLTDLFTLPIDSAVEKLIISVHAYTPYSFALEAPGASGSTSSFSVDSTGSTKDIDYFMDRLYDKFIKNGIPVVIGEFGARNKNNTDDRSEFSAYYIAAAKSRGLVCCWWDNNEYTGTGENFGLINRTTLTFMYPEIIEGLFKNIK